jgi:type I restriction enzyme S subunit
MKKLVPKRRFKEFKHSEAWEQRKLGEKMYIKARIGWQALTKNEYLSSGDYYLITGTDIDEDSHTVDLSRCFYVSKERYEMDDKIQVHEGDIIVTKDGTIGKVAMVTGLDKPATLNSHLFVLRDLSGNLDKYFLLTILNSHIFDEFVDRTKTGSTLTGMPQKTFVEFSFFVPNIDEQKKIATYFKQLDNLITLHQRKLKKLKNLRSAYLSEMFPKDGELYPKRRFVGFTDPWEECKIKDIFKVTRGYVLAATKTSKVRTLSTPYPVYSSQTANQGLMGYYNDYLYENAITWTTDGANAGTVNYRKGRFYCTNVCGVLISEQGYANKMVSEALNRVAWKHVSKVGNPKLMNNVISDIRITIPKNIDEQMKISNYFDNLDNLITLHQRKLEKLEALKQAYLSEMFI